MMENNRNLASPSLEEDGSDADNEEAEARFLANQYFVDRQTVEVQNEAVELTPVSNHERKIISRRYWSGDKDNNGVRVKELDPEYIQEILDSPSVKNFLSSINSQKKAAKDDSLAVKSNNDKRDPSNASNVSKNGNSNDLIICKSFAPVSTNSGIVEIFDESMTKKKRKKKNKKKPVTKNNVTLLNKLNCSKPSSVINLDDSDGESVVEVQVDKTPQPMICIESSDEEMPLEENAPQKDDNIKTDKPKCISPVPSLMSVVSDDFIQTDCRNLNISAKNPDFSFNFKQHGLDLIDSDPMTSSKSKPTTSTPVDPKKPAMLSPEIFATPKSNRVKKNKSYTITDHGLVTPFTDVYESESSDVPDSVVDSVSVDRNPEQLKLFDMTFEVIDSASDDEFQEDGLIMANVVNINTSKIDNVLPSDSKSNGNPELPAFVRSFIGESNEKITMENCSLNMQRFYNESWGGENFDHNKIKSSLGHDRDLWKINSKDRLLQRSNRTLCRICQKPTHKEERCPFKKRSCRMCGEQGHIEATCANKICLRCGSHNNSFSSKCKNCEKWYREKCSICWLTGHPTDYCPDQWRRYHLTQTNEIPLITSHGKKPTSELYCCNCAKKGHTYDNCTALDHRQMHTTSAVCLYTPSYTPDGLRNAKKSNTVDFVREIPLKKSKPTSIGSNDDLTNDPSKISLITIGDNLNTIITSIKGVKFMNEIMNKCNVTYHIECNVKNSTIVLKGELSNRTKCLHEIFAKLVTEDVDNLYVTNTHLLIPKNGPKAIEKLSNDLDLLKKHQCNPIDVYSSYIELKTHYDIAMNRQTVVDLDNLMTLYKEMSDMCLSLNLMLIGQMGLYEGDQHVKTLVEGLQFLSTRAKPVSYNLRNKLGKAYSVVFSPLPLKDYRQLINQYCSHTGHKNRCKVTPQKNRKSGKWRKSLNRSGRIFKQY